MNWRPLVRVLVGIAQHWILLHYCLWIFYKPVGSLIVAITILAYVGCFNGFRTAKDVMENYNIEFASKVNIDRWQTLSWLGLSTGIVFIALWLVRFDVVQNLTWYDYVALWILGIVIGFLSPYSLILAFQKN